MLRKVSIGWMHGNSLHLAPVAVAGATETAKAGSLLVAGILVVAGLATSGPGVIRPGAGVALVGTGVWVHVGWLFTINTGPSHCLLTLDQGCPR